MGLGVFGFAQASPAITNLEVRPSPVSDIRIIDPSQPDFATNVREIIPDAAGRDAIAPALPFTIVLRNLGTRKVAWVTVLYTYNSVDGRPGSIVVSWNCNASKGGMGSGIVALITPDGQLTQAVWTRGASSLPSSASYSERVGRMRALSESKTVVVSLDSAVYDNGEFVGADVSGRFSEMNVSANRDLDLVNGVRALEDGPDAAILTFLDRFANEKPAVGASASQGRVITRSVTRAGLLKAVLEGQGRAQMDISLERLAVEAQRQRVWRAAPDQ